MFFAYLYCTVLSVVSLNHKAKSQSSQNMCASEIFHGIFQLLGWGGGGVDERSACTRPEIETIVGELAGYIQHQKCNVLSLYAGGKICSILTYRCRYMQVGKSGIYYHGMIWGGGNILACLSISPRYTFLEISSHLFWQHELMKLL